MRFFNLIITALFPAKCAFCKNHIPERGLSCHECLKNIQFLFPPFCKICGGKATKTYDEKYNYIDDFCLMCIKHNLSEFNSIELYSDGVIIPSLSTFQNFSKNFYLDGLAVGVEYNAFIKKNVLNFKHSKTEEFAKTFARTFAKFLPKNFINNVNIIISVPIHKERLKERTFNQSALLIHELKKNYSQKFPLIDEDILIKEINSPKQKGKNKKEREANVLNTISINKRKLQFLKDKNILIIDDVIGSGATLNECAKILKKHGAKNVFGTCLTKSNKNNI